MKIKTLFFSLLALVLMGFSSVAQTTYTISNYPAGTQYAVEEVHVLDSDVTLVTTQCHFTSELRVYSTSAHNGFFYTQALPLNIQSLTFNMGYKVDDVYIMGSNDGIEWEIVGIINVTSTSYADYTFDFGTGNYNRFKFDVVGTQQIRVKSITINYKANASMVEIPVLTPDEGLYETAQNISMSCATSGASIYYTTDGTTPDSTSTLYTAPISVSTTTTIKAIAYKAGMQHSFVATKTYSFPVSVSNIAALRAGSTDGTIYKLDGEAILTFQTAQNNVKTIQDTTGAILVYDPSGNITNTYNIYDGITGLCGSLSVYGGLLEFVPFSNPAAATSTNNPFVPQTMTIPEISLTTDEAKLITIDNLSFSVTGNFASSQNYTVTDGNNNTIVIRTSYNTLDYIGTAIPETPKSITGIVTQYNGTIQFVPRSLADFVDGATSTPIFSATPNQLAAFNYIKDCGPSDEQAITVTGANLTGNVSVTCDSVFEISLSDSSQFVNTLTLTPENGSIAETVLVRMKAGLDQNTYTGTLTFTPSDSLAPVSYTLSGNVTVISSAYLWGKIESLSDIENNAQIIIAARKSSNITDYAVMTAATSGKPTGVLCSTMSYHGTEILPLEVLAADTAYIWNVTKVNDTLFTFTNLSGEKLGYLSSTNFIADTNYVWQMTRDTAAATAMIPGHVGFKIINNVSTGRGIALNTSNKFAPYATSNTASANYNFFLDIFAKVETNADTTTLAMPFFTPAGGEYWDSVLVSINCTTAGVTIHYTTDGSTPDSSSALYTAPLLINQTTTLKAVACKLGKADSNVATAVYTINITPVIPELTVTANLTGFAYDFNNGPSAAQSFNITGANLSQNVIVTAIGDYELATSATGPYSITLNVAPTNGSVNTDVYVRMAAGLGIGLHSGMISIVSDDSTTIALTGHVDDPNAVYFTETFDNLGVATSSSYVTGSFVGDNNITWNYVQSRHDVEVTGASLMLGRNRTPQSELNSGFINGGCGTISFDYMQAFSNNVNLNVYVNDSLVGNVTTNDEANVIKNSGTICVYVGGPFTLKFKSVNNSDGQVCIDNITWSNYNDGTAYTETPVFTPNSGTYINSVNVTLTCATQNADIYYSTTSENGPWTLYNNALSINQTSTVWAYAEKTGYITSMVNSAEYTIITPTAVNSISQLRQGDEDTYYTLASEAVITFQTSYRNVKYIQDGTGAILIDDNNHIITTTYNLYDGISGVTGTLTHYNGMLQFKPITDPGSATSHNNAVSPELITIAQLGSNYEAHLVKIENVTFEQTGEFATSTNYNISDATGEGVVRTQYSDVDYIGTTIPATSVTITALVLQYNGVMQLIPRSLNDIEDYDAIDENATSQISVHLTGSTIFVENGSANAVNMTVYNILGQPVMSKTIGAGLSTFSHSLASGTYIVKAGEFATKLVVK